MNASFPVKSDLLPLALACLGGALLAAAPAAEPLVLRYGAGLYAANTVFWLAALAGGLLYARKRAVPAAALRRGLLVGTVFILGAFPPGGVLWPKILLQSPALAGLLLLAAGLTACRRLHPLFARVARGLRAAQAIPPWLFLGILYCLFLTAALTLSWHCFAFLPTIIDSINQYMHAKFMAAGHICWKVHPLQRFFNTGMMITDHGKWFSQYQPLHVFLLSLGIRVGAPWLVNPMDGALTLLATYALARRIEDEATARLAALLTLACPFVVFMSSEYMNHATALLFGTLFMLCYVGALEALRRGGPVRFAWAAGCGLSLGFVFLTRPLDAVEIALPFALYSLRLLLPRDRRAYLLIFTVMAAGTLACIAFQGWYNVQTTGKIFLFPYARHHITNVPGFNHGHTLWKGLTEAYYLWLKMNQSLFEWAAPCTIVAAIACLWPLKNRYLALMLAAVFSTLLVNTINRYHSSLFGPRYIYELSSALIILSAAGIRRVPALLRLPWHTQAPPDEALNGITACLLLALFAIGWAYRLPPMIRYYSHDYIDGNPGLYFSMMAQAKAPALVFIEDRPKHEGNYVDEDYLSVAHTNPPLDGAPVIFARSHGDEENRYLIAYYPDRNAYLERGGILYPIDKSTFKPRGLPPAQPWSPPFLPRR